MDCVAVDDDDVPECVTCDIGYFFYEEPNLNKSSCVEQCPPAYFPGKLVFREPLSSYNLLFLGCTVGGVVPVSQHSERLMMLCCRCRVG